MVFPSSFVRFALYHPQGLRLLTYNAGIKSNTKHDTVLDFVCEKKLHSTDSLSLEEISSIYENPTSLTVIISNTAYDTFMKCICGVTCSTSRVATVLMQDTGRNRKFQR